MMDILLVSIVTGAAALVVWSDIFRVAQNERIARRIDEMMMTIERRLKADERYIDDFLAHIQCSHNMTRLRINALIDQIEAQKKAENNDLN